MHLLTQTYLQTVRYMLPLGWSTPSWALGRMLFHGGIGAAPTYFVPSRPVANPIMFLGQSVSSTDTVHAVAPSSPQATHQ